MDIPQADFWGPQLSDIARAVEDRLGSNYAEADVPVQPCPDLQDFGCAFSGLGGDPFLAEIGGAPLVHNPRHRAGGVLISVNCRRHAAGTGENSLVPGSRRWLPPAAGAAN